MRKSGILLPVSSLPGKYGIGSFGDEAYGFVDWLKTAGVSLWQVLPLAPVSYGDSPYQPPSAFAGNPYYIDLDYLADDGLLQKQECDENTLPDSDQSIDYGKLFDTRYAILHKAFCRFDADGDLGFLEFVQKNSFWLDDYSVFMAIKDSCGGKPWYEWEDGLRNKDFDAVNDFVGKNREAVQFYKFLQYEFVKQWKRLKEYANSEGISIIGDIPIYTSMDSADVWANPELFQLDKTLEPIAVAGCPPDGFSKNGQLWGNPLYDWEAHKRTGYTWWVQRMKKCFELYDVVRIDHFRGFDQYYAVPYDSKDAKNGKWQNGPGIELFDSIKASLGEKPIIAEDLGYLTDSVRQLLKDTGFYGIKVLQFAFDGRNSDSANDYLPHNYPTNCVVYTGTHDNHTLKSWIETITDEERELVRSYLCNFCTPMEELCKPLVSLAMSSVAQICIIPMQDYLELDDRARMNTPSTMGQNWKWRVTKDQLSSKLAEHIASVCQTFGRK